MSSKLGDDALMGMGVEKGWGGVWEGAIFLFCDLKMAYFGEF